jgi:signal transduction histidine kinase
MPSDPTPTAGDANSADRLARLLAVLQKGLGHELPNQLIAVRGLARLLELEEGDRLSAEGRDYLARLAAGAAKAHALVAVLAEVARLGKPAAAEPVDFAGLAAEAIAEVKQLADGRPAEYHVPEQTLVLTAPRAALRKLLVLLLRRTPLAGAGNCPARIEVSIRPKGSQAEIRVMGDGASLPNEATDRLFDPFGDEGGIGLDLFLVQQLAEGWGGSVRVEPRTRRGTTFVVTCPLVTAGDEGQRT